MMDYINEFSPFSYHEHEDGSASVEMYTDNKYKSDLFKTRKKEGFDGSGYDWESLAQVFIQEKMPDLQDKFAFDSEYLCFVVYSSDKGALRKFVSLFKEACEDDTLIIDLFSKTSPQEPITAVDMKSFLDIIAGNNK